MILRTIRLAIDDDWWLDKRTDVGLCSEELPKFFKIPKRVDVIWLVAHSRRSANRVKVELDSDNDFDDAHILVDGVRVYVDDTVGRLVRRLGPCYVEVQYVDKDYTKKDS